MDDQTLRIVKGPLEKTISCSRCGAVEGALRYSIASGDPVCIDADICLQRVLERQRVLGEEARAVPAMPRTTTRPEPKGITIDLADHEQLIAFLKYMIKLLERGERIRVTVE